MVQTTALWTIAGLLLGLALVLDDFGGMLVVALLGTIAFVASRVAQGELDLTEYLGPRQRRRAR